LFPELDEQCHDRRAAAINELAVDNDIPCLSRLQKPDCSARVRIQQVARAEITQASLRNDNDRAIYLFDVKWLD
jgi:hypothetical protein